MGFNRIRQTQQCDTEPVCTHCGEKRLWKRGRRYDRQVYFCLSCRRQSYGMPPDWRPRCRACKGPVAERVLPDGRSQYRCPGCKKYFLSEYTQAPRDRGTHHRNRHCFTFWLDRHARAGLVDYVQAKRCTDAQAVRAIFQYVLTGEVFGDAVSDARRRSGRPTATPVPRNPAAAAMKFPSLLSASAKKGLAGSGGHYGRGSLPTVLGVQRITVWLDDEAKEGLVHAMNRLQQNHADAARWLLANVRVPGAEPKHPLRTNPAPPVAAAVSRVKRISAQYLTGHDPKWDD